MVNGFILLCIAQGYQFYLLGSEGSRYLLESPPTLALTAKAESPHGTLKKMSREPLTEGNVMFTSYSRVNPKRIVKKAIVFTLPRIRIYCQALHLTDWSWANYLKKCCFRSMLYCIYPKRCIKHSYQCQSVRDLKVKHRDWTLWDNRLMVENISVRHHLGTYH